MDKLDYRKAGVDIEAGENAVNRIKPLVRETFDKNVSDRHRQLRRAVRD